MPWQVIHFKCQEKEGIALVLKIIDSKAILQTRGKSACILGHEGSITFQVIPYSYSFRSSGTEEYQLSPSAHCLHKQKLTESFGSDLIYCTYSLSGVKTMLFNALSKLIVFLNTYTLGDFSNILPTHAS